MIKTVKEEPEKPWRYKVQIDGLYYTVYAD